MAIHGLGGVWKTQIALNHANTSLESFDVILWVSTETQIKITQAFSSFAKNIGLSLSKTDKLDDDAHAAQKVKNCFNALNVGFLIVLDNVEFVDLSVQMWPSHSMGFIFIITRSSFVAWKKTANVIHLLSCERDQRIRTLTTLTGISLIDDQKREAAEKIFDQLGGLPLVIVQISDFIQDRQHSFSEFLPLYRSSAKIIIAKGEALPEDNHTRGTVRELSLQKLSENTRTLQQLLSFLEPESIEEGFTDQERQRIDGRMF